MPHRDEQTAGMQRASNAFYRAAFQLSCHPFIELTGFMNELIRIIGRVPREERYGIDTHGDKPLPMLGHEAAYIGEKFGCIFGPTFRQNPKLWKAFLRAAELDGEETRDENQLGCSHG